MSQEEQDQILGRLIRSKKESDRLLAALYAKRGAYAATLRAAATELNPTVRLDPVDFLADVKSGPVSDAISKLPTQGEILQLVQEIATEQAKNKDLASQIERFDV